MVKKIKSAWGVIYQWDKKEQQAKFFLIKRQALSKRIERIAPKGKIQGAETPQQAALREIEEETGMKPEHLLVKEKLDILSLQLYNEDGELGIDKDITFFLIEYTWDPEAIKLIDGEGFLGYYVWADIERVLGLIQYRDLRELYRKAYGMIGKFRVRDDFIKSF